VEPLVSLVAQPSACQYLPQQVWQLRYDVFPYLTAPMYEARLQGGWRRFGPLVFRPECPSCRRCRSLRVPVASFRPSESQRRAWKRNHGEVTVRVGEPTSTGEKLALYERFHHHQHVVKGWPLGDDASLDSFVNNPFPTEEWTYFVGQRLIGVGYVDALSEGLSAIYFFWDPDERHRSLGTFNVLSIIEAARTRGLPHAYLGYYVDGCGSLEYKARFRPNETLDADGHWQSFVR
jgi:arginine-tRNA-protein transferase